MSVGNIPIDLLEHTLSVLGRRRLRVFFYTSNMGKYLQARHVFARSGYILEHFSQHTQPYNEDYSGGKHLLLLRAVQEVGDLVGRGFVFFVEDTSLRIEALSTKNTDFPGLGVKEWFASTSFEKLDAELLMHGSDRRATIKSGIALHLPNRAVPVYFHGETSGVVAPTTPNFRSSPIHPWLQANSFDGWFIPDGGEKRLGEMTADESMRIHFRSRALRSMLDRLGEYAAILNLPSNSYYVRKSGTNVEQTTLFPDRGHRWIVVGKRAAGKTTFGEYAATVVEAEHFEGSTVIRTIQREFGSEHIEVSQFATDLHARFGEDFVIRMLVERIGLTEVPNAVVTGMRKFEELDFLHNIGIDYQLIYINASDRARYERYVQRARESAVMPYRDFLALSPEEDAFLRFAKRYADVVIENLFDLEHYLDQVRFVLEGTVPERPQGVRHRRILKKSILLRSMEVLASQPAPLTSSEVASHLSSCGFSATAESIARVLRAEPQLCFQTSSARAESTYTLSASGEAYVRLANARIDSIGP